MEAKCISLRYEAGNYSIGQGISGGGIPGKSYFEKGKVHLQQGCGWEKQIAPSRLILMVEINGCNGEIWVDRFFKDAVGKLTAKRVEKLEKNMPEKIHVNEYKKADDSFYYTVDENDLYKWKENASL
ncbi:hypothetical protein [Clostridium paridis]|uniref:Uncharacterized protein n=1 Tax=Clostridium paridis TaxID=2803863 RepID=A0A937FIM4_9CLOT|nr:hypothetical protein [Clostridium paridis]MBL4933032.1 hypothetical protein [Clostridium paridis]